MNGGANADSSFNINTGNSNLIPTQDVDVYVKGTNDRPSSPTKTGNVIAEVVTDANGKTFTKITSDQTSEGVLQEDGSHTLSGNLSAHDPDKSHGDAAGNLSYSIEAAASWCRSSKASTASSSSIRMAATPTRSPSPSC